MQCTPVVARMSAAALEELAEKAEALAGRVSSRATKASDEFEEDDGISHIREGGLTLVIGYEMQEDNSYKLTASIK